jgi:hypothetical protein
MNDHVVWAIVIAALFILAWLILFYVALMLVK